MNIIDIIVIAAIVAIPATVGLLSKRIRHKHKCDKCCCGTSVVCGTDAVCESMCSECHKCK
jgi:hypothetical protein